MYLWIGQDFYGTPYSLPWVEEEENKPYFSTSRLFQISCLEPPFLMVGFIVFHNTLGLYTSTRVIRPLNVFYLENTVKYLSHW